MSTPHQKLRFCSFLFLLIAGLATPLTPGVSGQSFVSVVPDPMYGSTDVPTSTPLTLGFDVAMQPSKAIVWSANVDPTKVAYSWSEDAAGPLPATR